VSQQVEQLAAETRGETPMTRLSQRVRARLSQVREDRRRVDPKLGFHEATALLLALQAKELALETMIEDIDEIQNGTEDPNKVLDFLGADELPAYHDEAWRED